MYSRSTAFLGLIVFGLSLAACGTPNSSSRVPSAREYRNALLSVAKQKEEAAKALPRQETLKEQRERRWPSSVTRWNVALEVVKTSHERQTEGNHHERKLVAIESLEGSAFEASQEAVRRCLASGRDLCDPIEAWPTGTCMYFERGERPPSERHLLKTQSANGWGRTPAEAEDRCWNQNIRCKPEFQGQCAAGSTVTQSKPSS